MNYLIYEQFHHKETVHLFVKFIYLLLLLLTVLEFCFLCNYVKYFVFICK